MNDKLYVKAMPGLKVPHEKHPRRYITEEKAEWVAKSTYYVRRIAHGELVEVPPPAATAPKAANDQNGGK